MGRLSTVVEERAEVRAEEQGVCGVVRMSMVDGSCLAADGMGAAR